MYCTFPDPGRLRTKDPRPHRAQKTGALWSVPAPEALPTGAHSRSLDASALGKGFTMA